MRLDEFVRFRSEQKQLKWLRGLGMILATLVVASLVVPVSIGTGDSLAPPDRAMSMAQKRAVVTPLISSVTICIARTVSANPRYPALAPSGNVNDLIVESVSSCIDAVQALIETYDRLFGAGEGENYFMGHYLEDLPAAVEQAIRGAK